jgi:hypothetical protein
LCLRIDIFTQVTISACLFVSVILFHIYTSSVGQAQNNLSCEQLTEMINYLRETKQSDTAFCEQSAARDCKIKGCAVETPGAGAPATDALQIAKARILELEAERDALGKQVGELDSKIEELGNQLANLKGLRDSVAGEVLARVASEVETLSEEACEQPTVNLLMVDNVPVFRISGQVDETIAGVLDKIVVPNWARLEAAISVVQLAGCEVQLGKYMLLEFDGEIRSRRHDELAVPTRDLAPLGECKAIGELIEKRPELADYRGATSPSLRGAWLANQVQGQYQLSACVNANGGDTSYIKVLRPDVFDSYLVILKGSD